MSPVRTSVGGAYSRVDGAPPPRSPARYVYGNGSAVETEGFSPTKSQHSHVSVKWEDGSTRCMDVGRGRAGTYTTG